MYTLAKPYGWVFFYQSRPAVETGDAGRRLSGNYPFLVDRLNGRVIPVGPFYREDLAKYERDLAPDRLAAVAELPPPMAT